MENEITLFESKAEMYSSFKPTSEDEEKAFFNAINSTENQISDEINEIIEVRDVYVEIVNLTDEETGEITQAPRIVLIDTKLKGHGCVSSGIFSACKKLFAIKGLPDTWKAPVKLKILSLNKGKKRILTFTLAWYKNLIPPLL